jgi:hypothetical protein
MGNIEASESAHLEDSSSAASFMNQIKRAVAASLSSSLNGNYRHQSHNNISDSSYDGRDGFSHRSTAELFVLPPRGLADEMMNTYWNQAYPLYPFLLPRRFMQFYHRLWEGKKGEIADRMTYCIINLVFAISCQITKREAPADKAAAAEVFCRRATHLLQVNLIGRASLELIQALLLMGQFHQSTEWPHRCWVVIGLAIRISQGLGLHLPRTTESILQQEERELARRLWHGCVFMDR